MSKDLIFEIGTEEVPASYIQPALNFMAKRLAEELAASRLEYQEITSAGTPRRLALKVTGLVERQPDWREEVTGPPKKAAFDQDGNPTKAALGFAKSRGIEIEDLKVVKTDKGEYLMAVVENHGQETETLLSPILNDIIAHTPFPKSMRWGSGRAAFARPVQWIVALLGDKEVECAINGIKSGGKSRGHRFIAPAPLAITPADYNEKLRQAGVIVDIPERRRMILDQAHAAAAGVGGRLLEDDSLLDLVTNLVEMPHAVAGSFDAKFLELPREVLITSMREHQKYFAVVDEKGDLMPNFVAINNIDTGDDRLAVRGHERVLRARLEDAFFFFREDLQRRIEDLVPRLDGVVFQAGLGTMLEKSERITALAEWISEKVAPETREAAGRAAHLAKADLLTEMVGEFPSLQGVMGREYCMRANESPEVCQAIAEHYMPVRAGAELPESITGAIVGIADRIDTIAGCFGIGKQPSGNTDPFGLRRLALGLIHIIAAQNLDLSLAALTEQALKLFGDKISEAHDQAAQAIIAFITGRYINDRGATFPQAAVEAVTSVHFDSIPEADKKIKALVEISDAEDFAILAGSFKRVRNILKGQTPGSLDPARFTEPAEKELHQVLTTTAEEAAPALAAGDYTAAMRAFLALKDPVDNFFDQVMVMDNDPQIRDNRISLMHQVASLFLKVGDFSRMSS